MKLFCAVLESSRFPCSHAALSATRHSRYVAFVLVGIFPAEQIISQCQWDGSELKFLRIGWDVRHWFSSGVSDEMARKVRGSTCYEAWRRRDAGSAEWLRGLTLRIRPCAVLLASACTARCGHGELYRECSLTGGDLSMRYHAGQPCQALGRFRC